LGVTVRIDSYSEPWLDWSFPSLPFLQSFSPSSLLLCFVFFLCFASWPLILPPTPPCPTLRSSFHHFSVAGWCDLIVTASIGIRGGLIEAASAESPRSISLTWSGWSCGLPARSRACKIPRLNSEQLSPQLPPNLQPK